MKIEFENILERGSPFYKITRIEGVSQKKYLPESYLCEGPYVYWDADNEYKRGLICVSQKA